MSKITTFTRLLINDRKMILKSAYLNFSRSKVSHILPDSIYLKLQYRINTGNRLNLKNPVRFNEKLQWLKLYDRKPKYTAMVDKHEAKEVFAEMFGKEHVIPTYGVWDNFDEIDFGSLPKQFVLKCTHDSGSIVICRDKSKFDRTHAKRVLEKGQKQNGYWYAREWPYKNVKPRIIAEKYMENIKNGKAVEMKDYKFYCFNGVPKYLYVSQGLENHETARISFFTVDWDFAPFGRIDYRPFSELPEKPNNFEKMVEIAASASKGFPFLRVDLYEINNEVFFSEFTFTPNAGYMPFAPKEWDEKLGQLITIPH